MKDSTAGAPTAEVAEKEVTTVTVTVTHQGASTIKSASLLSKEEGNGNSTRRLLTSNETAAGGHAGSKESSQIEEVEKFASRAVMARSVTPSNNKILAVAE